MGETFSIHLGETWSLAITASADTALEINPERGMRGSGKKERTSDTTLAYGL